MKDRTPIRSQKVKMFPTKKIEKIEAKVKKTINRRRLSSEETEDQKKLKELWDTKRDDLRLSQREAAEQFGYKNQAAISQYLNGKIPLNLETVLKFATLLKVSVEEISPRFADSLPKSEVPIILVDLATIQYITALNDSLAPNVMKGDLMVVDTADSPTKGIEMPTGKIVAVLRNYN
jgi:transcriptional regulator with XRE-family HTH domain